MSPIAITNSPHDDLELAIAERLGLDKSAVIRGSMCWQLNGDDPVLITWKAGAEVPEQELIDIINSCAGGTVG